MGMNLQQLLNRRFYWSDETISKIKKDLIYGENVEIINNTKSEKIVTVYGYPQVGKTELILFLLGISEYYRKTVYDVLRADVPRGNSSTSTAIIYKRSGNNLFGLCFRQRIYDFSDNIQYYDVTQFKEQLGNIRKNIEANGKVEGIIFIYIPSIYFKDNENMFNINILDLPGVESKNLREHQHVDSLMERFLSVSSAILIVCKANEIQSLEKLKLPNGEDWQLRPEKYIIITTYSYSMGSVRRCFKPKEEGISFYDFIMEHYKGELKKFNVEIECFPVELGDSFQKLIKQIDNKALSEQMENALAKTYQALIQSLKSKQGNNLIGIVQSLKNMCIKNSEKYINELCQKKHTIEVDMKECRILKEDLTVKQEYIEKRSDTTMDLVSYLDKYLLKTQSLKLDLNNKKIEYINDLKNIFLIDGQMPKKIKYKSELHKKVWMFYNKKLNELVDTAKTFMSVQSDHNSDYYNSDYEIYLNKESIIKEAIGVEQKIYDTLKNKIDTLIITPKTEDSMALSISYFYKIIDKAIELITVHYKTEIENLLVTKRQELVSLKKIEKRINMQISSIKTKILEYENDTRNLLNRIGKAKDDLVNDSERLTNYMDIAKKAYEIEYNKVVEEINNKGTNISDRIKLLFLLAIIESDYERMLA